MRTASIHIFVLVAFVAIAPWIAGCGDDDGVADAGRDGGRVDAGRDGGRPDGGRDGGRVDAGLDGGGRDGEADGGVDPAGWVPLDGLPEGCVIERAEHPEVLFDGTWLPCSDADNCVELAPDDRFQRGIDWFVSGFADGVGYLSIVEGVLPDLTRRITLLAATDGRVFGAWRDPVVTTGAACLVSRTAVDGSRGAFVVNVLLRDGTHAAAIYAADIASIGSVSSPYETLEDVDIPGSNFVARLFVSPTTVVTDIRPGAFLWVLSDGRRRKLASFGSAVPGNPQNVQLVGDHVLWEDHDARVRLAHGSIDDDGASYFELSDGDIIGLGTDGAQIAWQQIYDRQPDGTYLRVELWVSPYARDPVDLVPRMVAALPLQAPSVRFGDGIYAFQTAIGPEVYVFYDLADGRHRTITMPPRFGGHPAPLYVSATEVMITGNAVRRYQLDAIPYD